MTTHSLTSVLVANRGEIARRIFASCRGRGIGTVAVFSDADADSPHVADADVAVRLPGNSPAETYLNSDLIIAAARTSGADAIHPGYGFLSENADFARAVEAAGLVWIGPDPSAIDQMGSKVASKQLMRDAEVPVLERLDPKDITEDELPVLVKASAGGGGRGMRIVRRLEDLAAAIDSAEREATSAFGDGTVFCERYVESGHHIEVQVMADQHGTVWALGERECSLQRRHQKVIEEAPAPLVERIGGDMRERLLAAGRRAAAAVNYRGAGTVEFLADDRGNFWFLEMNTRLQVEHPVTECVCDVDLVDLQIDVASGAKLTGDEPTMSGHAVEARLYAEDPRHDWRPQVGTLESFGISDAVAAFRPISSGIRLDSGVESGSEVSPHYDAMLAKIIAAAPTREGAIRRLAATLKTASINGLVTNRDLLVGSLLHDEFLAGTADTGFYDRFDPADLSSTGLDPELAATIAALADSAREATTRQLRVTPGFRNVHHGYRSRGYAWNDQEFTVGQRVTHRGIELEQNPAGVETLTCVTAEPGRVVLDVDGLRRSWTVDEYASGDDSHVVVTGPEGSVDLRRLPRFVDPTTMEPEGALVAMMPGTVIRVAAQVGETVQAGQPLMWLEAMKMEHAVVSPTEGTVTELSAAVGDQVQQGAILAVVEEDKEATHE